MYNKIADHYVRRVSRRMPVGGKQKRQFLAVLKENVLRYMEENPATTVSQLEANLGSPDDIAADFISQMSYKEINNKFRARNRIIAAVAVAALLIVSIWAVAVSTALTNAKDKTDGQLINDDYVVME